MTPISVPRNFLVDESLFAFLVERQNRLTPAKLGLNVHKAFRYFVFRYDGLRYHVRLLAPARTARPERGRAF
jgi:hypothetical protein